QDANLQMAVVNPAQRGVARGGGEQVEVVFELRLPQVPNADSIAADAGQLAAVGVKGELGGGHVAWHLAERLAGSGVEQIELFAAGEGNAPPVVADRRPGVAIDGRRP